jgi:mannose-6-phosphate isomerase-like protein (cupin superfamily)
MKKYCILILFLFPILTKAQTHIATDTITTPTSFENIYNRTLNADFLTSSFIIVIKKGVKKHKHIMHSEHVYVLDGTGEMILGERSFMIKKGDLIFIPKNTPHALKVTSTNPVKVLSIQAPNFDGKDRAVVE